MDKLKVHIIPSFHYDLAYLRTFEKYLPRVRYILTEVLNLAKENPDYTFLFEQAFLLKLAASLIPERLNYLRKLITSGRIEATTPYIQTDNNMVLGESFLRNVLLGKELIESFGGSTETLWLGDVFGNNAQIPQIATICGLKYVQFSRGLNEDPPKIFIWRGLGPSKVLSYYGGYGGAVPKDFKEFRKLIKELNKILGESILLMSGGDYAIPDRELPRVVKLLKQFLDNVEIHFSTPSKFFHDLERSGHEFPIKIGDMNPTLTGTYGSRIKIKQRVRRVEYKLLSTETVASAAALLGWDYPVEEIRHCWEKLFMVQFHDVIAGSCVDSVYLWALRVLDEIEEKLDSLTSKALDYIASKAYSDVSGLPLIVFNPLPYFRVDVVKVRLNFIDKGITGVRVLDGDREIPYQLVEQELYGERPPSHLPEPRDESSSNNSGDFQRETNNNGIKSATLIFVAEIPPLGYKIFNIVEDRHKEYVTDVRGCGLTIENEFFKVSLNEDGTIKSLIDKSTGEEFVSLERPFFNNVILQIDRGDFYNIMPLPNPKDPYPKRLAMIYEEYKEGHELTNGELALAKRYYQIGDDKLWGYEESRFGVERVELVETGPVRAALKVSGKIRFWTTIRLRYVQYIYLYSRVPRVEVETLIEHHGKHYRLRVCFPTNIKDGKIRHEIPFGWIERDEGEYPALNWVDYSNEIKGLCLLNKGLPGNNIVDGTIFLTLMRSTAFEYKGESWRGFMEGEVNKYEYALVPHVKEANWFYPHILGAEYNAPLLAKFVSKSDGELPRQFSFLSVEPKGVMTSAIYVEKGRLIIRIYEAEGRDNVARVRFFRDFKRIEEVTADGRVIKVLKAKEDHCIEIKLRPFEIKTLRIAW